MEKRLADSDRAITILVPEPAAGSGSTPPMPSRKPRTAKRQAVSVRSPRRAKPRPRRTADRPPRSVAPEAFYRDLVWNLRNGVVAVTRDGRIAVMNGVAYRILALKPKITDIGAHYSEVLRNQPDVIRIISGAF